MKFTLAFVAIAVSGASAFAPAQSGRVSTVVFDGPEIGAGGMADTRNPDAKVDEDPRKSIAAAPSFADYLKAREEEQAAEGN
mmetsp:Transcript_22617/g.47917  ORF Transcript_22617/g.47917 Transcript_22617/m.47917 type:complete len:82 (-) Transcript_22617:135-380(-)|eukprot:CAMPEP_0201119166 /NCGR_PEP_ID=MMETSP0850-20130426/3331_1 /ASSEMBLY_ACC=CAM_ASM_000622 /TAXON_ID=183588 /ORGANISM="Pseudo-nitzschia fraudulenta, Strain WWA7" /LENGTH=81 /DNA_ID=CAMNT_0047384765 /DNA_START=160 /DNA_END=405 /DNA_ORIENTATION=+